MDADAAVARDDVEGGEDDVVDGASDADEVAGPAAAPPPATATASSSSAPCGEEGEEAALPAKSVRHIMQRAMGGDHEALTSDAVDAVQRCTGETISLVVSEARLKAAKEGRTAVGYADIMGVLSGLGFKCAHAQEERTPCPMS